MNVGCVPPGASSPFAIKGKPEETMPGCLPKTGHDPESRPVQLEPDGTRNHPSRAVVVGLLHVRVSPYATAARMPLLGYEYP